MFRVKDVWDKIRTGANVLRFIVLCLFLIGIGVGVMKIIDLFSGFVNTDPVVQTEYHYVPIEIEVPSGDIGFLGKFKKLKFNPIIWYDTVLYKEEKEVDHLMRYINADGKNITVLTQYCGEKRGKKIVYPYHQRFELVATGNEDEPIIANRYIEYWDWDKLLIGYSNTESFMVESRIHFLPLNLELDIIGSYNKLFEQEYDKKIEVKLLWRAF